MNKAKRIRNFDDGMEKYLDSTKKNLKDMGIKGKISDSDALNFIIKVNASVLPALKLKRAPKKRRSLLLEL